MQANCPKTWLFQVKVCCWRVLSAPDGKTEKNTDRKRKGFTCDDAISAFYMVYTHRYS